MAFLQQQFEQGRACRRVSDLRQCRGGAQAAKRVRAAGIEVQAELPICVSYKPGFAEPHTSAEAGDARTF